LPKAKLKNNNSDRIPLSVPSINGKEWDYVKECLDTEWVSSAGEFVDIFEEKIADYCGSKFAIACVNGTSALQISLQLSGVEKGDEVIISTLTFIAPVNAINYNRARPIFMDVDKYYNLDIDKTIDFIKNETFFKNGNSYNKKTKRKISAIIPVHIWGNAVWLDELVPLCNERNIAIVEDSSESLGSFYSRGNFSGQHTGSVGRIGCLSFNGNKIITCGGGGMIITDDKDLANNAHYLTTQAKDDSIKYIHNQVGFNFRLTNIQAAVGLAQFEQLPVFLKNKKEIHRKYIEGIKKIEGFSIAEAPDYAVNNHWMNLLQIENCDDFSEVIELLNNLNDNNVETRPVWALNHKQIPYKKCQNYKLEMAEKLINKSLCLPSSNRLKNFEINKVLSLLS